MESLTQKNETRLTYARLTNAGKNTFKRRFIIVHLTILHGFHSIKPNCLKHFFSLSKPKQKTTKNTRNRLQFENISTAKPRQHHLNTLASIHKIEFDYENFMLSYELYILILKF